jgi:hypothetical protein
MLRIKDEETAQNFLKASARIRQMRRSMRIRKSGLFQTSYKEEGDGSQTEIRETLAQEEHIKRMPTGQMEMLAPDKIRGVLHRHVHIRQPFRHLLPAFLRTSTQNMRAASMTAKASISGSPTRSLRRNEPA